MKKLFLFFLFACLNILTAQNSYKSNSGHLFKIGDTLKLGQPIKISSSLIIATTGEWSTIFDKRNKNLRNMNFINKKAIISEINLEGKAKIYFKLFGKKLHVLIDEAISKGEILVDKKPINAELDKYDKIKKLKELLDIGAITKEEYQIEKKKLLDGN